MYEKMNKMPEFCMIFARKIDGMPEFYAIFARKCPNFTSCLPEKNIFPFFLGPGGGGSSEPCLPVSYAKNQPESELRVDSFYPACNTL